MQRYVNSEEENRFKTIGEFVDCIIRGGEPTFLWKSMEYGCCFYDAGYCIAYANGDCEKLCATTDEVLDDMLGADRLRDVITQATVTSRNI